MKQKATKEYQYIETVESFAAYVNHNEKVIGIYCTNEDMVKANRSRALKSLKTRYKWKVQMVIK